MPTYIEQYNKIIQAYFRDEIEPFKAKFCFCGTLCDNSNLWCQNSIKGIHRDYGDYSGEEYARMERALFDGIQRPSGGYYTSGFPEYENVLFKAMSDALDVLKQIHIERGENIDEGEVPAFKKRDLALSKS